MQVSTMLERLEQTLDEYAGEIDYPDALKINRAVLTVLGDMTSEARCEHPALMNPDPFPVCSICGRRPNKENTLE